MRQINQWTVDKLASSLAPELREAVMGDLEELKLSRTRAATEMLGLALRQQTPLWRTWRPWLALMGIVGPIGVLLGRTSGSLVREFVWQAFVLWQYRVPYSNNGLTNAQEIETLLCMSVAVICWSWIGGYVLASLSGQATCVNGALFCLVWLLLSPFGGLIYLFARLVLKASGAVSPRLPPHGFGFLEFTFFLLLPLIVETILVLVPSLAGMRQALRGRTIGTLSTMLLAASSAGSTVLLTWIGGWQETASEKWSHGAWRVAVLPWQERIVPLVVLSWPALYLVATMAGRAARRLTYKSR